MTTTKRTTTAAGHLTAGMTIKVVDIRPVHELLTDHYLEQYGTDLTISCGSVKVSSPVVTIAEVPEVTLVRGGRASLREVVLVLTDGRRVTVSSRQRVQVIEA